MRSLQGSRPGLDFGSHHWGRWIHYWGADSSWDKNTRASCLTEPDAPGSGHLGLKSAVSCGVSKVRSQSWSDKEPWEGLLQSAGLSTLLWTAWRILKLHLVDQRFSEPQSKLCFWLRLLIFFSIVSESLWLKHAAKFLSVNLKCEEDKRVFFFLLEYKMSRYDVHWVQICCTKPWPR